MTNVTYKLVLITNLLTELDFAPECHMRLYCDRQVVVYIAENLKFYELTEHIEVDCYLVCQKIEEKIIQARYDFIGSSVGRSTHKIS